MSRYRHPPGCGPRPPGVPPGYMLVDDGIPARGLGALGGGGVAAGGIGMLLLGIGIGYFLGHKRAAKKVEQALRRL